MASIICWMIALSLSSLPPRWLRNDGKDEEEGTSNQLLESVNVAAGAKLALLRFIERA